MTDDAIDSFRAEFAFLSNFHPSPIILDDGETYPTAEHAFQALKTDDPEERRKVREAPTPAAAKSRGKKVTLRSTRSATGSSTSCCVTACCTTRAIPAAASDRWHASCGRAGI